MAWNKFSGVREELLVFAFVVLLHRSLARPINSHSLKNNFQRSSKEKTIKFYVFTASFFSQIVPARNQKSSAFSFSSTCWITLHVSIIRDGNICSERAAVPMNCVMFIWSEVLLTGFVIIFVFFLVRPNHLPNAEEKVACFSRFALAQPRRLQDRKKFH